MIPRNSWGLYSVWFSVSSLGSLPLQLDRNCWLNAHNSWSSQPVLSICGVFYFLKKKTSSLFSFYIPIQSHCLPSSNPLHLALPPHPHLFLREGKAQCLGEGPRPLLLYLGWATYPTKENRFQKLKQTVGINPGLIWAEAGCLEPGWSWSQRFACFNAEIKGVCCHVQIKFSFHKTILF